MCKLRWITLFVPKTLPSLENLPRICMSIPHRNTTQIYLAQMFPIWRFGTFQFLRTQPFIWFRPFLPRRTNVPRNFRPYYQRNKNLQRRLYTSTHVRMTLMDINQSKRVTSLYIIYLHGKKSMRPWRKVYKMSYRGTMTLFNYGKTMKSFTIHVLYKINFVGADFEVGP